MRISQEVSRQSQHWDRQNGGRRSAATLASRNSPEVRARPRTRLTAVSRTIQRNRSPPRDAANWFSVSEPRY